MRGMRLPRGEGQTHSQRLVLWTRGVEKEWVENSHLSASLPVNALGHRLNYQVVAITPTWLARTCRHGIASMKAHERLRLLDSVSSRLVDVEAWLQDE